MLERPFIETFRLRLRFVLFSVILPACYWVLDQVAGEAMTGWLEVKARDPKTTSTLADIALWAARHPFQAMLVLAALLVATAALTAWLRPTQMKELVHPGRLVASPSMQIEPRATARETQRPAAADGCASVGRVSLLFLAGTSTQGIVMLYILILAGSEATWQQLRYNWQTFGSFQGSAALLLPLYVISMAVTIVVTKRTLRARGLASALTCVIIGSAIAMAANMIALYSAQAGPLSTQIWSLTFKSVVMALFLMLSPIWLIAYTLKETERSQAIAG